MKWGDFKRAMRRKLAATETAGKKHDFMTVTCCIDKPSNRVQLSRGSDDMHNGEIRHVAESLGLNEFDLRRLVACTLTTEEFCAKQSG